jgi:hypothetical protein
MRWKRRTDLLTRVVNGEVIILDHRSGKVHHLNATAGHIWNACEETGSPTEIAAGMAVSFADAPNTLLHDVIRTLADFERLGFLVDHPEPEPAREPRTKFQ